MTIIVDSDKQQSLTKCATLNSEMFYLVICVGCYTQWMMISHDVNTELSVFRRNEILFLVTNDNGIRSMITGI